MTAEELDSDDSVHDFRPLWVRPYFTGGKDEPEGNPPPGSPGVMSGMMSTDAEPGVRPAGPLAFPGPRPSDERTSAAGPADAGPSTATPRSSATTFQQRDLRAGARIGRPGGGGPLITGPGAREGERARRPHPRLRVSGHHPGHHPGRARWRIPLRLILPTSEVRPYPEGTEVMDGVVGVKLFGCHLLSSSAFA